MWSAARNASAICGNRFDYRPLTSHYLLASGFAFAIACGHSLMVKFQPSKLAMRVRFPLPAHFRHVAYSCPVPCSCLRSHVTFLRITRPPFTSARDLPSFGSNTLTSAGSAARKPQKFGTPLYLNASLRTSLAVSGRCASAVRE